MGLFAPLPPSVTSVSLLRKCARRKGLPVVPLMCKWRDRFVQRFNLGRYLYETCKIYQYHRALVISRVTMDRVPALCGGQDRSKNSRPSPPSTIYKGMPHFALAMQHLGRRIRTMRLAHTSEDFKSKRKRQSCHKLVIGNWTHHFTHRKRARTGRGSQKIFCGYCWHLFDQVSWL